MARPGDHKGQYISKREMRVGIGRATTRAHPPHPLPARPYYTTNRPTKPCIVGAGEDVDVGLGLLWLPVRVLHHISSPYLQCIDHKGRPYISRCPIIFR